MNRKLGVFSTLSFALLLSPAAHAQLFDRGGGLIYDSDQDITWIADPGIVENSGYDTGGRLNWHEAKTFVDNLEYAGYTDWRLPKFKDELTLKPGCDSYSGLTHYNSDCGDNTNPAYSELAYMFHTTLGNHSMRDQNGTYGQCPTSGTYCLINKTSGDVTLDLLNSTMSFWTDTYLPSIDKAIWFGVTYGQQADDYATSGKKHVWAVRDGDSSIASPVFDFTDITNAPLQQYMETNTITVSGVYRRVPISIVDGQYQINNSGIWYSGEGLVGEGDTVTLKRLSSDTPETTVSMTVTIGLASDTVNVTTRAFDAIPLAFAFDPVTNAEFGQSYDSNEVTIQEIDRFAPMSVVGGEAQVNGSGYWFKGNALINPGDRVQLRGLSSDQPSTTTTVTLTVGTYSAPFNITTKAADITPEPFYLNDVLNADLLRNYNSNVITVRGINVPTAISIVGGEYAINGGGWTSAAGTVVEGDTFIVRRLSSDQYDTMVSAVLTVGTYSDSFDITTRKADTSPNPFKFIDVTDANLDYLYTSNSISITGIDAPTPISIVRGEYRVNGGAWSSVAGTVENGDTVEVRRMSANTFATKVAATLTVGNYVDSYDITTKDEDTSPNPFTFIDVMDADLDSLYTSNTISVTGINAPAPISIVGGEYSVNGGGWTAAAGTVVEGDTVRVQRMSANAHSTQVAATLTVGNYVDSYDITTKAFVPDTTPEPFTFVDVFDAEISLSYTSNSIMVMGVNTDTPVSITAGQYRVNGGAWTSAAGSVVEGDVIEVSRLSSDQYSTLVGALLSVGTYSDSFDITTMKAPDITPDPFTFVDVVDAELDLEHVSNAVTITGIDTAIEVTVIGGECRINGGAWTNQLQYAVEGDVVEVRRHSSTENSTMVSAILTAGTESDSFDITTKDAEPPVCEEPSNPPLDPAELAKLIESELAGFEYSLDIWDPWSTGYCADIVVTNNNDKARPYPYGVHFKLPVDTEFTGTWNGEVTRNGEDVTVIFPSWMQDVEANSKTLDNEQFGFCAKGKSEPQGYTQFIPDFSKLSIDFIAHNVWNGGYCGHFEMTYTGNEPYIPSPNMFKFNLSQSVEMTEYWNEIYTRDGDVVTVDLPYWSSHIYQNTTEQTNSGFCTVGDQLPCGFGYNGNSTIVELIDIEDTYVASGSYSTNYGQDARVQADGYDSNYGEYVSLLQWDVSSIPQGVAITGAELSLNIYENGGEYGLFAMNGNWSEETATWSNSNVDANQGVLIGLIEEGVNGNATVKFNQRGIALVQQWIDGGENHGLMIRSMGSINGIIFDSSEDAVEASRPKLTVTYKKDGTPLTMPAQAKFTDGVDGYTGTEDSRIKSGSANTNYGYQEYVTIDGLSSGSEFVGLLKWDLSAMPTNANVVATEIVLTISDTSTDQYNLYAMNGSWNEDSVTWNSANIEANQGVLIGTVVPHYALKHTLVLNDAGVELVQGWIDGSVPNNGLIIRSAGTTKDMRFRSSEYGKVSKRPTINVTYH